MPIDLKALKKLTNDLSVLYVEDELSIQKTMAKYLNKFFASVMLASNGLEGIQHYNEKKFDLIITDIPMIFENA